MVNNYLGCLRLRLGCFRLRASRVRSLHKLLTRPQTEILRVFLFPHFAGNQVYNVVLSTPPQLVVLISHDIFRVTGNLPDCRSEFS
jgi:hypothetical protein